MNDETAIIYLTSIEQDLKSELNKEAVRYAIKVLKDRRPVKTTEPPTPHKTIVRPEFLELLRFLQKEFPNGVQTFFTRNVVGDSLYCIYKENDIQVDWCPNWEYIEIFGLKKEEKDFLKRHFDKGFGNEINSR